MKENQSPQHDLIIQYNVTAMQNTKGPSWSSYWKIFISFTFASLRQNLVPFTIPHSCSQLPIPLDYLHHYLLLIIYLKRKPQLKIMEPKEERERDCLDHEEKEGQPSIAHLMPQADDKYNEKLSKDKKIILDKETDGTLSKIRENQM
jgi:hypothetical protein